MVINKEDVSKASAELQGFITRLDVDAVGIASVDEWKGTKLEETALKLLPTARSVVVMAMEIYPEIIDHARPGRTMGKASLNDLLNRNADFLSRITADINNRQNISADRIGVSSQSRDFDISHDATPSFLILVPDQD